MSANPVSYGFSRITLEEVLVFLIPFVAAVVIDLRSHKHSGAITMKDAAIWSLIWVLCSIAFGFYIYWRRGPEETALYGAGYILEKALAVDNLFAFYLIFKSFGLISGDRQRYQHRILYWGVLAAILLRVLFLSLGTVLAHQGDWVMLLFALIVLWTVWKMWNNQDGEEEVDYSNHWSVRGVRRFMKVNSDVSSGKFFDHGATPLFLCLVCINICDVVFAFDSMPVIIAVVKDPYLMITSSLWAAAGLRSLYFLLVAARDRFWALDRAVMILLAFIGVKLIFAAFHRHMPISVSLPIVGIILLGGILFSLFVKRPS